MLAFLELTPRGVQEAKASRKFGICVHLDTSQIGIVCFTKRCLGFSKFRILKKLSRFYFFQRDSSQTDDSDLTRISKHS